MREDNSVKTMTVVGRIVTGVERIVVTVVKKRLGQLSETNLKLFLCAARSFSLSHCSTIYIYVRVCVRTSACVFVCVFNERPVEDEDKFS